MIKELDDYDWEKVFNYCGGGHVSAREGAPGCDVSGFDREDVAEILAMDDGDNDGPDWIGLFRLKDGRLAFVSAGCDFTGWGCRESGYAIVGPDDVAEMVRLALGEDARTRLKL